MALASRAGLVATGLHASELSWSKSPVACNDPVDFSVTWRNIVFSDVMFPVSIHQPFF